jgi:peptidoglycan/LPS O-acetylase OafA/YrhL
VLAPAFVLLLAILAVGSGPLARLLSTRPLQALGHASYAMYILQQPVLIWSGKLPFIGALPPYLFIAVFVGMLIACSLACRHYLAEPARRWLQGTRSRAGSNRPAVENIAAMSPTRTAPL